MSFPRPAAARVAAKMLAIALALASVGSIDFAAQTTSSLPPGIVVPYGGRPFVPLNPSVPDSAAIAVLRGDPDKGSSTMLMKMSKAAGRLHVHTADYELVVIEGTMQHWRAGEEEAAVKPMGPGSYWFQPGGAPHADSCLTDTCVMYITWSGPRDARLANQ
jgi:quercetin dioxygenase-like cupin family protein